MAGDLRRTCTGTPASASQVSPYAVAVPLQLFVSQLGDHAIPRRGVAQGGVVMRPLSTGEKSSIGIMT